MPLVGMALLLAGVTRNALRPLHDPDTWWHLRLGELFRGAWSVADPGEWSPFATRPWVPTQWLPEVVASTAHDLAGLAGVAWLAGATELLLVVCLYLLSRREVDRLAATVATFACFVALSGSLSARPHLVTYVLLAVTTGAWLQTAKDLRPRWWLIPLTWLWACSHGMWFTGIAVGVAVVIGLGLDRRLTMRLALRLAMIPTLCVIAAALTPAGPELIRAPFAVNEITPYIQEWAPPAFRDLQPGLAALIAGVIILTWCRRTQTPWVPLAVLALASLWVLFSARTVALGAVMMTPLLADAIQSWIGDPPTLRISRPEWSLLAGGVLTSLLGLSLLAPFTAAAPANTPTGLADELDRLSAGTTILNSYAIGGWLHWRHPELTPIADGLTEAYGAPYLKRFIGAAGAQPGWRRFVDSTGATHALLERPSSLASALQGERGWERIGVDGGYVLLRAPRDQPPMLRRRHASDR